MTDEKLFIETLLAGAHSLDTLRAEFGASPGEDMEVNLAEATPADFGNLRGSKIRPIPGVRLYLDSGDELTDRAIDMMEEAMETAYQVKAPYYITSMREGEEGTDLRVLYFYLDQDDAKRED